MNRTEESDNDIFIDFHCNKKCYIPKVKETVCYIVAGIVIKDNKILMMQETKSSCYGQWYLPAGHLEKGETLTDGVKREVLEETGMEFDPQSLIAVEIGGSSWYRFTFIGRCIGGAIKTKKDAESIRGAWLDLDVVTEGGSTDYTLRGCDICRLVRLAVSLVGNTSGNPPVPFSILPRIRGHQKMLARLIFIHREMEANNQITEMTLISKKTGSFPVVQLWPGQFLEAVIGFCRKSFSIPSFRYENMYPTKRLSVLGVDFHGCGAGDGLLLDVLLRANETLTACPSLKEDAQVTWNPLYTITHPDLSDLVHRCKPSNSADLMI